MMYIIPNLLLLHFGENIMKIRTLGKVTDVFELCGEERAGCFAYFVFLVSRDCCLALPRCAMGLSAVCDCDIS